MTIAQLEEQPVEARCARVRFLLVTRNGKLDKEDVFDMRSSILQNVELRRDIEGAFMTLRRLRGIQSWYYESDGHITVLLNNGTLEHLNSIREIVLFLRAASSVISR